MVGTATLTEPIITALVSDPRIIDRLMAQRAEGVTTAGVTETRAASAEAACLSGGSGGVATCCSFIRRQRVVPALRLPRCHKKALKERAVVDACLAGCSVSPSEGHRIHS